MGLILAAPFLLVLIVFALSNNQPVRLGMWPTDLSIEVPISIAVLVAGGLCFLLGGLMMWFGTLSARGRARRAERQLRHTERELHAMRVQATTAPVGASSAGALPPSQANLALPSASR